MTIRRHGPPQLAVCLAFLTACRAPERQDVPTDIELPERFVALTDTTPPDGDVPELWWRTFDDPRLDELVRDAFSGNRNLRVLAHRLTRGMAEATIAGADLWPKLEAGVNGQRQRINFIGFPIQGAGGGIASTTYNQFGLALRLSWELDLWGRVRSLEEAALAEVQASEADLAGAFHSLAGQVTKAYFAVIEARKQLELTDELIGSYRDTHREVQDRAAVGLAPQVDARLAAADLSAAQALREQRRETLERNRRALQILLGHYPDGAFEGASQLPEVPGPVPIGLPAQLLTRRPDLAAAERRVAAARSTLHSAEADLLPRFSLTASGGTTTAEVKDLLDGDFRVWSIAGNVLQPIFEGGRLRARVRAREAEVQEAIETFADSLLQALSEVETALAVEGLLAERETHLSVAVREAREAMRLAEDRYREGLDSLLPVLEAKRRVLDNESAAIAVRGVRLQNRVDLHLALGGGYPSTLDTNEELAGTTQREEGEPRDDA